MLFCGEALPYGLYITFPIALILGIGFHTVTPLFAILLMYLIEFPLTRVFQFAIMPWISFDKTLEEHHNEKS